MAPRILQGKFFKSERKPSDTIGEFLFNSVEQYKEKISQIDADLDKSETYASVKERSVRLAVQLKNRGISSEDVVSFCCFNSLDVGIAVIATFFAGAKVACLDPSLSARNAQHLLSLVTPKLIFVDEDSVDFIEKCLSDAKINSELIVLGESAQYSTFSNVLEFSEFDENFRPTKVDADEIAIMFFSSGTTGLPKAICHSHCTILNMVEISLEGGFNFESNLHFTTFYWISGLLMLILPFFHGGTRLFARTLEGEKTLRMIEKYKITSLFAAPVYTYELTRVQNPQKFDLSSFQFLLTVGTSLSIKQFKNLGRTFPNAKVLFGYGLSECGIVSVFHPEFDKQCFLSKLGSCGKVTPNTQIKIVDLNNEEVLGANQKGEIRIKNAGLMKGYYKMDHSDAFDRQGFLKTGDVGYFDEDGCIYVVERIKEMFKYLSWQIVPSVIEAVLLEHPLVQEAVVFGIPRGEEVGEIPAGAVVLKENCDVHDKEIEQFVAERVSDKEKLRGGVVFVEKLPRTPTGKIIRKEAKNILIKST